VIKNHKPVQIGCPTWIVLDLCCAKAHSTALLRFAHRLANARLSLVVEPLSSWFKSKEHNIKHQKNTLKGCFFGVWLPNSYNVRKNVIDLQVFLEHRSEITALKEQLALIRQNLAA